MRYEHFSIPTVIIKEDYWTVILKWDVIMLFSDVQVKSRYETDLLIPGNFYFKLFLLILVLRNTVASLLLWGRVWRHLRHETLTMCPRSLSVKLWSCCCCCCYCCCSITDCLTSPFTLPPVALPCRLHNHTNSLSINYTHIIIVSFLSGPQFKLLCLPMTMQDIKIH